MSLFLGASVDYTNPLPSQELSLDKKFRNLFSFVSKNGVHRYNQGINNSLLKNGETWT